MALLPVTERDSFAIESRPAAAAAATLLAAGERVFLAFFAERELDRMRYSPNCGLLREWRLVVCACGQAMQHVVKMNLNIVEMENSRFEIFSTAAKLGNHWKIRGWKDVGFL